MFNTTKDMEIEGTFYRKGDEVSPSLVKTDMIMEGFIVENTPMELLYELPESIKITIETE